MILDAHPWTRDERGQASLFVLGMALVVFSVAGLAVDGTRVFLMRRTLQNAADSAALAAAGELDTRSYYSSGGDLIRLSSGDARTIAQGWLADRGIEARSAIGTDAGSVSITLRTEVPTTFLGLIGIEAVAVGASSTSEPVAGSVPE